VAGETLGQLQQRCHHFIRKRHHLQMACSELEEQVSVMKQEAYCRECLSLVKSWVAVRVT
jgi:predicted sugar kinase